MTLQNNDPKLTHFRQIFLFYTPWNGLRLDYHYYIRYQGIMAITEKTDFAVYTEQNYECTN